MQQLFERAWPVGGAKGAVCIVHGLAEHSGRYEHVAAALNRAGYSAFGIDLRGHGNSPGHPGEMGDLDANISDVAGFCARVSASHDKTFLLAHSMGTLLALPAVAEMASETLDGLILSGTAVFPGEATLASIGAGKGIDPDFVSRDPAVVEAYKDDPLVFYDRVPSDLLAMAGEATTRAQKAIALVRIPLLVLHGTEDKLCSLEGANHVHVQCNATDKTLRAYKGLYHEILNEPERDEVLRDIVEWLDDH